MDKQGRIRWKGAALSATTIAGLGAISLGAVAPPTTGALLSMIGAVLVLVRALFGASEAAHAHRARIVRREVAREAPAIFIIPWSASPRPFVIDASPKPARYSPSTSAASRVR